MKKILLLSFICILCLQCEEEFSFIAFEKISGPCDDCPHVEISFPLIKKSANPIAKAINNDIKMAATSIIAFNDSDSISSLEGALLIFNKEYEKIRTVYPDEQMPQWELNIDGQLSYESESVLTLILNSFIYAGGAHGYSSTTILNYDKLTGKRFKNEELFSDFEGFKRFVEQEFRLQENIPKNDPINSTGFMFDNDRFYLPENIGYSESGILLIYNMYEIASYAEGPVELSISYESLQAFKPKL